MEIWEERYFNEKENFLESPKSFQIFQQFLTELNKPRNVTDLATYRLYGEKKTKPEHRTEEWRKEYRRLRETCTRYKWFDRAAAYDKYWLQKREEAKQDMILDAELKNIPILAQRLDAINIDFQEMLNNNEEKLIDSTKAKELNTKTLKTAVETLYLLLNGGTVKTENKNTHKVSGIDYFSDKEEFKAEDFKDDVN